MKTIWKYNLSPPTEVSTYNMPKGAKFLTIQQQGDFYHPCMWFEVDDEQPKEMVEFLMVGTGHPLPDESYKYLGTGIFKGGELVFHIYTKKSLLDSIFI